VGCRVAGAPSIKGGRYLLSVMATPIPAAEALAILRAAGVNAQKSPARGRCRTLCYLVAGQYVNLGRLRELAREALAAQAAPAEAEAAPAEAEPAPAVVAGCRLAGDARHLFALFARRYSLTPAQCFALQSEALSWADRVALWCNGQPIAGPFGALTPGLTRRGVITLRGASRAWVPDALAELWAIAQAQAEAEGLRPVPALADAAPAVVAEPEAVARLGFATFNPETEALGEALPADCYPPARPEPALPGEVRPGAAAPDARPVLPGEAEPPASVAQDGPAPVLPNLPRVAPASVARGCFAPVGTPPRDAATLARLRADAAAGRPVSLAALAGALAADPAAPGRLRTRAAGEPWDPGTPEARARVALQGERVATLWPIAQAVRGAGFDLPPVWWADGPILAGERTYGEALAALPLGAIAAAATALAALPPVTAAQDRALRLCRGEAVGV